MKTWNHYSTTSTRFIAAVLLVLFAVSCSTMPKTPEEAYKAVEVRQVDGNTVVQAPIQYAPGANGAAAYGAVIEPNLVLYKLVMHTGGEARTLLLKRDVFEKIYVPKGFGVVVNGRSIFFPPAYFIGFLRRVDEEIAKRKKAS